jgi:hypothetical protein
MKGKKLPFPSNYSNHFFNDFPNKTQSTHFEFPKHGPKSFQPKQINPILESNKSSQIR